MHIWIIYVIWAYFILYYAFLFHFGDWQVTITYMERAALRLFINYTLSSSIVHLYLLEEGTGLALDQPNITRTRQPNSVLFPVSYTAIMMRNHWKAASIHWMATWKEGTAETAWWTTATRTLTSTRTALLLENTLGARRGSPWKSRETIRAQHNGPRTIYLLDELSQKVSQKETEGKKHGITAPEGRFWN